MSHSAVLLAGGKSSRMGRDKARLPVAGTPLWRRQVEVLKATCPAELFISTARPGAFAEANESVIILPDALPGCGPLGGIATAIARANAPFLLVLAVDMPAMPAEFLVAMVDLARREGRGIVPRSQGRFWEPLAAVYPCCELLLAKRLLDDGVRKMESFIDGAIASGAARALDLKPVEEAFFENWNEPKDVREIPLP